MDSLIGISMLPACGETNTSKCIQDTTRIDCFIQLCRQYQDMGKYNIARIYGDKALELSRKIDAKSKEVNAHNRIAEIYRLQGNYSKALEHHFIALRVSDKINYTNGKARASKNIGVIYYHLGEYDKALEGYFNSLEIYKTFDAGRLGVGHCLHNIGTIYFLQKRYREALQHFKRTMVIKEEFGDKVGLAAAYIKIGVINIELVRVSKSNANIAEGDNYWEEALTHLNRGMALCIKLSYQKGEADAYNNLGELFFEKGNFSKAITYLNKGLEVSNSIGTKQYTRNAYRGLAKVYKETGNFNEALKEYEQYIAYRDSLVNEENNRAAIYQQTKYEFEKAQLIAEQARNEELRIMNEELSRRDNLQYSIILIAILVLFGGVLSLGFINVSEKTAEGIIFFSFLILFEFFLVLADPYIDKVSGGAPGIKLLFNAGIAAFIFPMHSFFETKLKGRIVR